MNLTACRLRPVLFGLLLCLAQGAHADIYLCRDANGTLVSSDRMTNDCLTYGGKVIGPDGTVSSDACQSMASILARPRSRRRRVTRHEFCRNV